MLVRSRSLSFAPIAVALAAIAVACRTADFESPVETEAAPAGVPAFIDASDESNPAQASVDFGRVRLGAELRRELRIANRGAAAFTITEVRASERFSASFRYAPASFTVDSWKDGAILVSFAPTAASSAAGDLFLHVDNGTPSILIIHLRGRGYVCDRPEIAVAPSSLAFGDLLRETSRELRVAVGNAGAGATTGADNLRFGARDETGLCCAKAPVIVGPDAAEFSLDWPVEGYSTAGLDEGAAVDLRVRFTASSTGRKDATLVIDSNDAVRPRLEVPLSAVGIDAAPCEIGVAPPALNFGIVATNHYLTLGFSAQNLDPDPAHTCLVSVLGPSASGPPDAFALVGPGIEQRSLLGGEALFVAVRFQPRLTGISMAQITLLTSDPTRPEVTVSLVGVAEGNCLVLAPRDLDFGAVPVRCSSQQRTVTVYNTCVLPVTVTTIDLLADGADQFAITGKPTLPRTVASGGELAFGVTFRPTAQVESTATVAVQESGALEASEVALLGEGVEHAQQTDRFTQSEQPKVDVLFIVDNSVSMADKQASLASNFASFISYAALQKVDMHLAVTTTDVTATGAAGQILPLTGTNPRVLTRTMANLQQLFSQNVAVGTSGSETESLIRPAYLALSNPLVNAQNAGFYRDEATLGVVIVSDAADQDPLNTPVSFYESFLRSLKGLNRNVTVSAIIPTAAQPPAGCTYDTANAGLDPRVAQLVWPTNGLVDDICTPDWHKTLEKMGTHVFGVRTTFFLSNTPDMTVTPDPIVITVDGQRYDPFDPRGVKRWDFSPESDAIVFDPLAVPDFGSEIAVTYYVACR